MRPSRFLVFLHVLEMYSFQVRSEEMVTPRFIACDLVAVYFDVDGWATLERVIGRSCVFF